MVACPLGLKFPAARNVAREPAGAAIGHVGLLKGANLTHGQIDRARSVVTPIERLITNIVARDSGQARLWKQQDIAREDM